MNIVYLFTTFLQSCRHGPSFWTELLASKDQSKASNFGTIEKCELPNRYVRPRWIRLATKANEAQFYNKVKLWNIFKLRHWTQATSFLILFLYSHICLNCTAYSVSVCFMFDVLSGVYSDDRAFHVAKYIKYIVNGRRSLSGTKHFCTWQRPS